MPKPTEPVKFKQPIRLVAADQLQEAILSGRYQPGQEVPQLKLAASLGLSQASTREAIQELEHRGLLVRRGRTRTVTDLSEDELADIFQVRTVLEPLACRLAANHWNRSADQALEQCLLEMREAGGEGNYQRQLRADLEFHRALWKHQPNRQLERHLNVLCVPLFAYELVVRADSGYIDYERSFREHHLILSVLRTRDGNRAERIMKRLVEKFHREDRADYRRLDAVERATKLEE
jgi:DNA-binding GntR family transcriptional regulator